MKPLNLSSYAVAKEIEVSPSRILDSLHDERKTTVDTYVRLGKLFGVSPKFFLNIQNDIETRNVGIKTAMNTIKLSKLDLLRV